MKVVILCGGQGTRLREETEFKPKPMVEIGGKPMLWHIMKLYSYYGHNDFILCLGYKGEVIKEYFINYDFMNNDFTINLGSRKKIAHHNTHDEKKWNVTLVNTGPLTPKGGRIKMVEKYLDKSTFMLTYGDGIGDINIDKLIKYHKKSGKIVTFTGVGARSRFATVKVDKNQSVVEWKEKEKLDSYINGGFFVMEPEIFKYLTLDTELEVEPMEAIVKKNKAAMFRHDGFWECMDTYRDYNYLNGLWGKKQAKWAVWLNE